MVALSRSFSAVKSNEGLAGVARGAAAFGADEAGGAGFAGAAFGAAAGGDTGFAGAAFGAAGAGGAGFVGASGCDTGVGCGESGGFRAHPAVSNINDKAAQTTRMS